MILSDLRSAGPLWAFAFSDARGAKLPEGEHENAGADWVWSHFALSDQRSRAHIERMADLPSGARACLLGAEARVQTHAEDGWTYGVLPELEREFDGASGGAGRLFFALDQRRLITARRHPLLIVDGMRRDIERANLSLAEPADAVAMLVARFIDATEARLVDLSAQLDHAEDAVLSDRDDIETLRLGPIRRELSGHHREFQALRSAFHRATSHRNAGKGGALIERLPALVTEIEDFDRDVAGLQDRARLLYDEIDSKTNAALNRSLRALTILSTLLLPPTLIVGAFGMNVHSIPFAEDGAGFWSATGVCVLVVAICYIGLKYARILR